MSKSDDANLDPDPEMMQLEQRVLEALEQATQAGATGAEAAVSISNGLSVSVRLGDVETVEHARDKGMAISVYFGQHKGSASTNDLGIDAVASTVDAACRIAKYTEEDPYAGLADAGLMPTEIPNLDLHHPWDIDPDGAIDMAMETEDVARAVDSRITNSDGAAVSTQQGIQVYGNTHGFVHGFRASRHSLSCTVIAEDDSGMQRDYWYSMGRHQDSLESPQHTGAKAAERALRRLGASKLSTREVPVIFAAEVASGLIGHLVSAVRGSSLYRRASFLLDQLGQPVMSDFVHIHEQPHLIRGLGSSAYDSEGVATSPRDLVRNGVLTGYVLDSYAGRKLGMQTTANAGGVHNLTVEPSPGAPDFDDLVSELGTGLVVTELMGMGVDIVTGDYSRGAAGFWVKDGQIGPAVHEITVAGNLREMLQGIRGIGRDVDLRRNIRVGSILINRMTVAGD